MQEWNGKLISEMTTYHIENTISYLKKTARRRCKRANGSDWKLYLDAGYQELVEESNKRDVSF